VLPSLFFGWEVATDTRRRAAEIVPPSKKVVVTTDDPYKWPAVGADGESEAQDVSNPYWLPNPGWESRWKVEFEDSAGKNGQIAGYHIQSRVFARVQLGRTWYRSSYNHNYRFRASAKRSAGKWNAEPRTQPVLQLNNHNWAP